MQAYRQTKAMIDLGAIRRNTEHIVARYPDYTYYMAVVKADCYGYRGNRVVKAMLDGGANCLAVSLLEEGLELRKQFPDLPILLFTPLPQEQLSLCVKHNLWITVATLQQAVEAAQCNGLQAVIRVNGGSDILGGPTNQADFEKLFDTLQNGFCELKGLYLHNYHAECKEDTEREYRNFEYLTQNIDLTKLSFISISNSLSLPRYAKKMYCNACRLGNILYNIESDDPQLEHTFRLVSKVLSVFSLNKGQSVAYSHAYTAQRDQEILAAIPIGFGDGFAKVNIGRDIFISGKRYPIVAITMDITLIRVDNSVNIGDAVELIRDNKHLDEISAHIHGATEEPIVQLNKRVYREYIGE